MISYVNVDYDYLDEIIKKRGTTRSKCAEALGIHPGTLGNSFIRRSKMKADLVAKLAKFLNTRKIDLLAKDEWGNVRNYNDWEAITDPEFTSDFDREYEEDEPGGWAELYSDLNHDGKQKLFLICYEISELMKQIPKYKPDYPDYPDSKEMGEEEEHTDGIS